MTAHGEGVTSARKGRVLCVDNRASRNLALFLLTHAGYEVVSASSLRDALRLSGERFDLRLVNHELLRGAGHELSERLRGKARATPLLFYSTVIYPFSLWSAGETGTIDTPVPVTEVAVAVARALGAARGRRTAAAR